MDQQVRVHRPKWLGHVEQMSVECLTKRTWKNPTVGNVRRGTLKKTREETVKNAIETKNLELEDVLDIDKWRCCCSLVFPDELGCWPKLGKVNGNEF